MKSIFQHQSSLIDMSFTVKEYLQPHFTSPFHFHDSYELIYIAKSFGKLYSANKIVNFKEGEVYLLGSGFAHCFHNDKSFIQSGETAHAIVTFFKEDFLGKDFFNKGELVKIKDLLNKSGYGIKITDSKEQIKSAFHKLTTSKGMDALIILLDLLNKVANTPKENLYIINSSTIKPSLNFNDSGKLDTVVKYVVENFKNHLDNKEAASLACLNEAAFCRYFKRRTEKTFSQFVNYVRISHATSLLLKEEMSIANICFECGFNNISYFNRQFKEIIGQTPLEYRKAFVASEETVTTEDEEHD